jgi:hypothetical protein
MKKNSILISALILFTISYSCDDILEENIVNDDIQIISPINGHTNEGGSVQFLWNFIDGADEYNIQIFNQNQSLELDSLVTETIFNYDLNPGNYQWRVKGINFAYETAYSFPQSFEVQLSQNLAIQELILNTPSDNFYTNNSNIVFTWSSLTPSEKYNFLLIQSISGQQTIHQQDEISDVFLELDPNLFALDAEYIWKVKAVNSISETPFTEYSLFIDRTPPNQPVLVSPVNQGNVNLTVSFDWSNGSDVGGVQSPITNNIEISTEINFQPILVVENTSANTYQYNFSDVGTYYWRVKATDEATNESIYSAVREIIVQ